jgi:hypothetical protein
MFWIPKPALAERVGRHYRRKTDNWTWELVELTDATAKLRGPGYGKGTMTIDRSDFQKEWVLA